MAESIDQIFILQASQLTMTLIADDTGVLEAQLLIHT